jgi:hypothetical protein
MNGRPHPSGPPLLVAPGTITRTRPSPPRDCIWRHSADRVVIHPPIVNTRLDVARFQQINADLREEAEAEARIRERRDYELKAEKDRLAEVVNKKLKEQEEEFRKAAIEREERHRFEENVAQSELKNKRIELENQNNSTSLRGFDTARSEYFIQKEDPSVQDSQKPRILYFQKTDQPHINCSLPINLSRNLNTNISEKDRPIMISSKQMSSNIPRSETFSLGGGFQSIGPTEITTLVRQKLLMKPSKPARIVENGQRQPHPEEKRNLPSVIDGDVNEIIPLLGPVPNSVQLNPQTNLSSQRIPQKLKQETPDYHSVFRKKDLNSQFSTLALPNSSIQSIKNKMTKQPLSDLVVYKDNIDGFDMMKSSSKQ